MQNITKRYLSRLQATIKKHLDEANERDLIWKAIWNEDLTELLLLPTAENELGFGQTVTVTLTKLRDDTGDYYNRDGKLILQFTTIAEM